MYKIRVNTKKAYDVIIENGILENSGNLIKEIFPNAKIAVISDDKVFSLYGDILLKSLEKSGFDVVSYTFPNGEKSKNAKTYLEILEFLAKNQLTRSDIAVALGGGVTGDMAGFAAGTYLREIPFVQIPTTLLAAVDSSVGGKTGINLDAGKNLAGVFHQPSLVICDPKTLDTLDAETLKDGVAEAIKYGMICDSGLFNKMSGNFMDNIAEIIKACVEIKRDIVTEDEFDKGTRQLLNFGHTIGHAIEKCSSFNVTHGHAVAMGMKIITNACERNGFCKSGTYKSLVDTLEACGLINECNFSARELYEVTLSDKKRAGNSITLVLPEKIGKCVLKKVQTEEVLNYIEKGFLK